jgi:hypothetical protein
MKDYGNLIFFVRKKTPCFKGQGVGLRFIFFNQVFQTFPF